MQQTSEKPLSATTQHDAVKLLADLVLAMQWWASQEDGIPDSIRPAFDQAQKALGWPQAEPASTASPSAIPEVPCANCHGFGTELTVYEGKVPCRACQKPNNAAQWLPPGWDLSVYDDEGFTWVRLRRCTSDRKVLAQSVYAHKLGSLDSHVWHALRHSLDASCAPIAELSHWRARALNAERLLNSPELHDFARGVVQEAAHQRQRWGTAKDADKSPADWVFLVGHLATRSMMYLQAGNVDKALHHTITTAAALANWHSNISGADTSMWPSLPGQLQAGSSAGGGSHA
ncbi:hypothetical protein [Ralstonia solanacearum]|uniref:hypothetical protein n=1 Tax=Ralstonia solanacearum TaxID=305 RepID=UPI0005ACA9AE|nr:hypothetical protein [Ralstonia solanacearum]MDC6180065.1 hypothetical protein [Ralstonia solanacearum]MDC6241443.1 hypothetical protein [Ralstonia solanacearum]